MSLFGLPTIPIEKRRLSINIWIKNIDKILFILKDLVLVLQSKFEDKTIDIKEKREITNDSIKLSSLKIFKLNIDPKNINKKIIIINPANILNVNLELFDIFLKVS